MEDKNMSPQSIRLNKFIMETGFSYSEFARQCKIPQTRSITAICSDGKIPTGKLLDKIIKRFPQLNYDWVLLGYGEMIVQGMQVQPANANSLKKSRDASYENIQEFLENHDYTLNSLANKIEKALLSSVKVYQNVNDRLDVFENNLSSLKDNQIKFIDALNINTEKAINNINVNIIRLENDFKTVAKEHLVIIDDLDKKRMNFLDTIKKELIETSNLNTKKAMDLLTSVNKSADLKADSVLGEFVKHTNPKPEK